MYGFESFYFFFFLFYSFYLFVISNLIRNTKERKKYVLAIFFPLFFLAALRGETVGGDLQNYLPAFDAISHAQSFEQFISATNTEPGFSVLNFIISCISPTHRAFLVITSFISLIGPALLIYRYSSNPAISALLYFSFGFYTNTYNNVRQSIALSLCFISIIFILDKKKWKWFFLLMVASVIHYSAIVCFLLYPITKYMIKIKNLVIVMGIAFALFYFAKSSIMGLIVNSFFIRYDPDSILNDSTGGWPLFVFYFLILIVETIFYLFHKKNISDENKKMSIFFIALQLMATIFQIYATIWSSMTRVTLYFYIPVIVAIPFYINMCEKRLRRIYLIIVLCFSLLFLKNTYSYNPDTLSNSQGVIPYVLVDITLW